MWIVAAGFAIHASVAGCAGEMDAPHDAPVEQTAQSLACGSNACPAGTTSICDDGNSPKGTIPYRLEASVTSAQRVMIRQAMDDWQRRTRRAITFSSAAPPGVPTLQVQYGGGSSVFQWLLGKSCRLYRNFDRRQRLS